MKAIVLSLAAALCCGNVHAAARLIDNIDGMAPKQIRLLREKARLSQAVFAAILSTSVSSVQKWEIGDKKPSGPSLKLLSLIQRKGLDAVL